MTSLIAREFQTKARLLVSVDSDVLDAAEPLAGVIILNYEISLGENHAPVLLEGDGGIFDVTFY